MRGLSGGTYNPFSERDKKDQLAHKHVLKQADKIEQLEKDHGWHEEEFDFILQFMRTILLKRMCWNPTISGK